MGSVYKAYDEQLNRFVAIKVLLSWTMLNPLSRARLLEEASCAGALNHPHIVTIYQMAREGDTDFIVMEYLDGKTLDRHIPARGLPLSKALTWAQQIGSALAAAHKVGILHRDLKPSNVMVTREGNAKLLDFGLALRPGVPAAPSNFGTKAYMAPEQFAENAVPDQRSEIFSFGLVLYQLLTGKTMPANVGESATNTLPYSRRSVRRLKGHIGLAQTVRRCLEKDPRLRFQNMSEVLSALKEISILEERVASQDDPSDGIHDPTPARAIHAELRKFGYASLAQSRGAFSRMIRLVNTASSDRIRQTVASAMKKLIMFPPGSNGEVSMPVREVRKLALDLLRAATQNDFGRMEPTDFQSIDLYGMNFGGLLLNTMSFQNSFLVEANFRDSGLQNASFSGASIRNANFTGADLTDCDLTDADWFHAVGLTEDQLSRTRKNTLRSCPPTIRDMRRHLAARYKFPFSSWNDHLQEEIVAAWKTYLRPGGLRDKVAQWRSNL